MEYTSPNLFNTPVFHRENSAENQKHFEENVLVFTDQCREAFEAMMRGEYLTTVSALLEYHIGDCRRRIKDLLDTYKVPVESEYVPGTRYKRWFIKEENRAALRLKFGYRKQKAA